MEAQATPAVPTLLDLKKVRRRLKKKAEIVEIEEEEPARPLFKDFAFPTDLNETAIVDLDLADSEESEEDFNVRLTC